MTTILTAVDTFDAGGVAFGSRSAQHEIQSSHGQKPHRREPSLPGRKGFQVGHLFDLFYEE